MRRLSAELQVGLLVWAVALASSTWTFPISSDGAAALATAEGLSYRRTLAIDERFLDDDRFAPSAMRGVDGRAYSKYGLGLPLVQIPLLRAADGASRITGLSPTALRPIALSLLNPFLTALTAALILAACRRLKASPGAARLAALGYAFTTLAWAQAVTDSADPLQACLVAAAAYALAAAWADRSTGMPWVCGAALAGAVLAKTTVAALVPAFVAGAWLAVRASRAGWRHALAGAARVAAPAAAAVAAVGWLNWLRFGSLARTGYNSPVFTNHLADGLYGLLVGPNKGLVFYAPMAVLIPVGLVVLCRRSLPFAVTVLLALLTWIPLNAVFYDWGGGWCWGPRYLLPVLPLGFAAIGVAADLPVVRRVACALGAAGAAVSLLGVAVSEDAYRRTIMDAWLADRTGFVLAGSARQPGELVKYPRPPEDVLPEFSSIAGHWWLARVALGGCDCDSDSAECACRTGPVERDPRLLSPPWRGRFGDAVPRPPYGASIIQPRLLRALYRRTVIDPAVQR
jgi:hypothetical protein